MTVLKQHYGVIKIKLFHELKLDTFILGFCFTGNVLIFFFFILEPDFETVKFPVKWKIPFL